MTTFAGDVPAGDAASGWEGLAAASNAPFIYGGVAHAFTVFAVARMFLRRRQANLEKGWTHVAVTIGCLALGHLLLGLDLALRVDPVRPEHGEDSTTFGSAATPIVGFLLLFVHGAYTWMHEGTTLGVAAYTLAMAAMCMALAAMYAYGRRAAGRRSDHLRCNPRLPFWPRFACDDDRGGARGAAAVLPRWLPWLMVLILGGLAFSYVDGALFGWVDLSGETHQYRFALLLVAIFYLLNLILVVLELERDARAHALSISSSIPGSPAAALA
jgi:hypothetical protein